MENLFIILVLLSIIALIVGVIVPNRVLFFMDKKKRNRKNVLLIFGLSTVIFFILYAVTSDDIEDTNVENEEPKEEVEITGDLKVELNDEKAIVTITTNAIDGSIFEVFLTDEGGMNFSEGVAEIQDGKAVEELEISDEWNEGDTLAEAIMSFNSSDSQSDEVKELYGEYGENIKGEFANDNLQGDDKDGKNISFETEIGYPSGESTEENQEESFDEKKKELDKREEEVAKKEVAKEAEVAKEDAKTEEKEVKEVNTFTKEETDYTSKVENQANEWSGLWFNFAELMSNPNNGDEEWMLSSIGNLIEMKELIKEARELNPPKKFEEVNALYMKAVDNYEVVPTELPDAIDNADENHMVEISESIEEGNNYMDEATELVSELIENN